MTIPDISAQLIKEGHAASKRTIAKDLSGVEAQAYLDELMRKQLMDISVEQDSNLRMKYRGQIIMRLLPAKVEQKVQGELVTFDVKELVDDMLAKEKENAALEKNR